jgi:hypothetical protein
MRVIVGRLLLMVRFPISQFDFRNQKCCILVGQEYTVKISTALHRALQDRTFELDSLIPPEERQKFVDGRHPNNANVLLDGILAHPFVREFSHLLDLGFLPMRIASKLGEMQRAGACRHKYVSFEVVPPALNSRLEIRGEEHYADILGFPCYLGNSEHANVVYRGDDFDAASNIDGLHHTSCGDWQALFIAAKLSCRAQWAACRGPMVQARQHLHLAQDYSKVFESRISPNVHR